MGIHPRASSGSLHSIAVSPSKPQGGPHVRRFMVVDHDPDVMARLSQCLLQTFPSAVMDEYVRATDAIELVATEKLDAIIVNRPSGMDCDTTVRMLRALAPEVLIIVLSGNEVPAIAAGASAFLPSEEWLRLGKTLGRLLNDDRTPHAGQISTPQ